jgi:hypothetical protein
MQISFACKIETDKSTGWFPMNDDEDEYRIFGEVFEALALRSLCSVVSLISLFLQSFLLDVIRRLRRWRYGFECSWVLRTVYCNLPVIKIKRQNRLFDMKLHSKIPSQHAGLFVAMMWSCIQRFQHLLITLINLKHLCKCETACHNMAFALASWPF